MSPNDAQGNATAPKTATILIPRGSSPRALYNELTADLLSTLGDTETRRASHVETWHSLTPRARAQLVGEGRVKLVVNVPFPGEQLGEGWPGNLVNAWWADMTPVHGPILGPFTTKPIALRMETEWLQAKGIPLPDDAAEPDTQG